jgi:hypothetical protein
MKHPSFLAGVVRFLTRNRERTPFRVLNVDADGRIRTRPDGIRDAYQRQFGISRRKAEDRPEPELRHDVDRADLHDAAQVAQDRELEEHLDAWGAAGSAQASPGSHRYHVLSNFRVLVLRELSVRELARRTRKSKSHLQRELDEQRDAFRRDHRLI